MSINLVFLLGNLTRDPVLRRIASGTSVVDMGLAVSETRATRDGGSTETTTFVDIAAWGKQAEACAQFLRKGSPVFIEGKLQLDEWTDKEGKQRTKVKVRAERVQFLGRPPARPSDGPEETSD
jgi:single-strand DNA-binding protein